MKADLEALYISDDQLEKITGLDINRVFMGGIPRPSALRSARRLASFLMTEFSILAVTLMIVLGLGMILARTWHGSHPVSGLLLFASGMTSVVAIAWHSYQWHRYQSLKRLAHLLDEVDRHNEIVQAVHVMDELEGVPLAGLRLPNRDEVRQALEATQASLISALMTDRILRRHQRLMQRREELFRSIETNLATLQSLTLNTQASDYQQFLQEALAIGLAVREAIGSDRPFSE